VRTIIGSRTEDEGGRQPVKRCFRRFGHSVALLAAALGMGCGPPQPEYPNVLLITVDTLRADRLGAYGSKTTRTPHVDRLAREGVLFENAMAPIPVTRPSHFSLLSSLYPRDHGVVNNRIALPEEIVTVTQVLQDAGYDTAGFTGTSLLSTQSGAAAASTASTFPTAPLTARAR
jgi:arylsulfatase A-like enzyme